MAKNKKVKKIIICSVIVAIGIPIVIVGAYATYVLASYHRIGDKIEEVNHKEAQNTV